MGFTRMNKCVRYGLYGDDDDGMCVCVCGARIQFCSSISLILMWLTFVSHFGYLTVDTWTECDVTSETVSNVPPNSV